MRHCVNHSRRRAYFTEKMTSVSKPRTFERSNFELRTSLICLQSLLPLLLSSFDTVLGHSVYWTLTTAGSQTRRCVRLFRHHTSDAVLELAVLGGVDERVDTAVGEHQYHGEVVEPTTPKYKAFSQKLTFQDV